jgi:hypothetical protein
MIKPVETILSVIPLIALVRAASRVSELGAASERIIPLIFDL